MQDSTQQLRARLPTKITGIVFWGTVFVGLILTLFQMRTLEEDIRGRHALQSDRFTAAVVELLAGREVASIDALSSGVVELVEQHGLEGAEIVLTGQRLRFGSTAGAHDRHEQTLQVNAGPADSPGVQRVVIYLPAVEAEVARMRKELLITMGVLFSAFGFILQWILQQLLTRPFIGMVTTAQRFTAGDEQARFDETRQDEFGFLGKFFNKALDYLLVQQDELRDALARVRESESALYHEKERVEVTLHSIGDAVITTDETGCIEYFNPVAERLTGYQLHEVQGRVLREIMQLINENTRQPVENPIDQCLKCGEILELADHTVLVRADGEEVAIADSAAPIRERSGGIIGAVMVFHDVGHARKLARQLSYQATHDALTGLYNRREFEQRLKDAIEESRLRGDEHALCYLDLDQFKLVNDTCGHIAGDELLRQIAVLLQGRIRDADILARLGGDEFGVLLMHCSLEQARRVAEDLRKTVRDFRFVHEEHSFEIGVSIGVVTVNASIHNMTEVYSAADVACYAAKDSGRNRIHVYKPDDHELKRRQGEMRWVARIRKAIEDDRFVLYSQVIEPVSDPGLPVHYEILLRICDENGQEVPPMAFIPAAERYNMMPEVDRWVVDRVLDTAATIERGPLREAVWTINISGRSLGDDEFLRYLLRRIADSPVPAGRFCFEITETAAIANLRRAARFIKQLKSLGCRFALDDFGSGLSSFAYLKNLEVDYLKIDGSFVRDMVEDPIDHAMVEAINNVGHVMNIQTIAEFVENDAIREALQGLGVNYAQGYGIGRPQPLAELLATRGLSQVKARDCG